MKLEATFINSEDNVPFMRVYKSLGALKSAIKRMESNARFRHAVCMQTVQLFYPKDL